MISVVLSEHSDETGWLLRVRFVDEMLTQC